MSRSNLYRITSSYAPLYRDCSDDYKLETQVLHGVGFNVYEALSDWVYGREVSPIQSSRYKGYKGWIPRVHLSPDWIAPTHLITALRAPIFLKADIKSPVLSFLHMGAHITAKQNDAFVKTNMGYIHQQHVKDLASAATQSDFVTLAETFIGAPYVWGGVTSDGLDCSGLVLSALRASGRDFPRDTSKQVGEGTALDLDTDLKRGDLVFWQGHVAIMQSATHILHANAYHMCVCSEPLREAKARIAQNYGPVTAMKRLELG